MRVALTLVVLGMAACADRPTATAPDFEIPLLFDHAANSTDDMNFTAPLSGEKERPVRDTRARGNAIFHVNDDGTIDYKLVVANISNVRQAHIHLGGPEDIGPVVVFLYGPVPGGGGRIEGVIAMGTITHASLIGPLAGQTLPVLLERMRGGTAYVNVHTDDGVAPANTGPGDFPGGEIRSQVMSGHVH